jgi:hypothetical protein
MSDEFKSIARKVEPAPDPYEPRADKPMSRRVARARMKAELRKRIREAATPEASLRAGPAPTAPTSRRMWRISNYKVILYSSKAATYQGLRLSCVRRSARLPERITDGPIYSVGTGRPISMSVPSDSMRSSMPRRAERGTGLAASALLTPNLLPSASALKLSM